MGQFLAVPIFILAALLSNTAHAEYRAFELVIRNTITGNERRAVSTLDHIQYPEYYPITAGEVVEYVRSWMCWGRTDGHRPICPPPEAAPAGATP